MFLRQSTASQEIILGTFLDDTDGKTAETALTIANTDIKLWKHGQTTEADKNSGGATHIAAGRYSAVLDATDTDTVGTLEVNVAVAGALPVRRAYQVLEEAVYDRLFATDSGGYQVPIWASATSTVNLSGTTIKTAIDVETDTQDIQARLPAALVDGRMVANAQIVGDKAGYSLTQAFPANFSLLSITVAGAIASVINVVNVDELGEDALTANGAIDDIPPAVWNALTTETYVDGSFGDRVLISTNNNRTVAVTGSNHVASVLHDAEPNSIPEDAFQNGAVSARVIATDAIDGDAMASSALTEIANAVGAPSAATIAAAVGTLQVLVDMGVMIINDGTANARFSVSALQNAPAGEGGGGQTINVYPVSASTPERVAGTTITFYRNESRTVSVVTDFTLTALTLVFVIEDSEGNDLLTIADGSISRSDKTFTVSIGTSVTATISNYRWALRDITGGTNSVIARGVFSVQEAASNV